MKTKFIQIIMALAVLAGTTLAFDARAEMRPTSTGNDLMQWCNGTEAEQVGCDMYFFGVIDGLYQGAKYAADMSPGLTFEKAQGYCVPKDGTMGQLKKVIIRYLEDHPESLDMQANVLAHIALLFAFPCK